MQAGETVKRGVHEERVLRGLRSFVVVKDRRSSLYRHTLSLI